MAYIEKLKVINSITGFNPYIAAPTPMPVNPCSEMGVSQILESPNLSYNPLEIL